MCINRHYYNNQSALYFVYVSSNGTGEHSGRKEFPLKVLINKPISQTISKQLW